MAYQPLAFNKEYLDYTGVTAWHESGYRGAGVKVASGECFSLAAAASYGLAAFAPVGGYEGGTGHGLQTALVFWQAAPDAALYMLPYPAGRLINEALPVVAAEGVSLMFTSCTGTPGDAPLDAALGALPDFAYFMSAGNDGDDGWNYYLRCANIFGVGAYTLGGGKPIATDYSSGSEYVDFAAPTQIRIPRYGTLSTEMFAGTSCSAPFLAGMCALAQQLFIERTGKPLSRKALYQFLADNSTDFGESGKDTKSGWGAVRLPKPEDVDVGRYTEDIMTIKMQIGNRTMTIGGAEVILDQPPVIDAATNRTLAPVRALAEALGCAVDWDNRTKTITITR